MFVTHEMTKRMTKKQRDIREKSKGDEGTN